MREDLSRWKHERSAAASDALSALWTFPPRVSSLRRFYPVSEACQDEEHLKGNLLTRLRAGKKLNPCTAVQECRDRKAAEGMLIAAQHQILIPRLV